MNPAPRSRVNAPRGAGWAALLLVASVAGVYARTLHAPFVFDDQLWVTWNESIRHLSNLADVVRPSLEPEARGRPLLNLTFALDYALSGQAVWSYHLTNLVIHAGSALALFGLVRRTIAFVPAARMDARAGTLFAFSAALLWAVHPLCTSSVTYTVQRAESLMALFYLLVLYSFARAMQEGPARTWQLLCVLFCILGVATKEVMVTAPLALLSYDRTFVSGSFRQALRERWPLHLGAACSWLVLGFLMVGLSARGVGFGLGYSAGGYFIKEGWVVAHYLLLAVWPHPLVFDYGPDVVGVGSSPLPWGLLVLALLAAASAAFLRRSALGFAAAFFFLVLAPTSSFVPVSFQPMAENRMYLPLAACSVLVVAGAWRVLGLRALGPVFLAAAALAAASWERNLDYRSEESLWADTVAKRPGNPRARIALGSILAIEGRHADAARQFTEALRLDPGNFEARRNLGLALIGMGKPDEALGQLRQLLEGHAGSEPLHFDLGLAYGALDQPDKAIAEYRKAVEISPDAEALNNLANELFNEKRDLEAVPVYAMALRVKPDSARVHFNLALTLARMGGTARAEEEYKAAIRLDPSDAETHNSLGCLFQAEGRRADAAREFREALSIRPDYPVAKANLETATGGR